MESLIKYVLLFFFYSFAGWCLETTYCSLGEKRFINRGFLTGPLCPIYGAAATVLTVMIYNPFKDNMLAVFVLGIILCDIVEYVTSYVMEKLFNARWWDYTYELLNVSGRICLKHSLYWGVISIVFIRLIHPSIDRAYDKIPEDYTVWILSVVVVIFVLDLINAVRKAADIRKLQTKLKSLTSILSKELNNIRDTVEDKYNYFHNVYEKQSDKITDIKYQIEDLLIEFDKRLTFSDRKKASSSSRIFYNNPMFEKLTKIRIEKLKNIIYEIKSNLSASEEMQ